jgi:K+-transporting ATPase KdpF subunit
VLQRITNFGCGALVSDALSPREPAFASLESALGRTNMIFDYALAGLVSAGLLFYLTYALLRPERF